jgi:hypothetical protein
MRAAAEVPTTQGAGAWNDSAARATGMKIRSNTNGSRLDFVRDMRNSVMSG